MRGRIVKALSGFYYVETDQKIYRCRARGQFKQTEITPLVGDLVDMVVTDEVDDEGVINDIEERKNSFIRPPVANVDMMLVVIALKNPRPAYQIVDRFLVTAEALNVDIILCINKIDLGDERLIEDIKEIYSDIYESHFISCKDDIGIEDLTKSIEGKNVALAGPSGVGKSTLLNRLQKEAKAETGSISKKTNRGKHTTRHVEMFHLDGGGMIFDTPGFTSFDILDATEENLAQYYPEMEKFRSECKFKDCKHVAEPGCKVIEALEEGRISKSRYDSYKYQLEEIRSQKNY